MIGYATEFVLARHHSVMCFDFIAVTCGAGRLWGDSEWGLSGLQCYDGSNKGN